MEKIIKARNLSLTYHSPKFETLALNELSFEIEKGEFVAIVGPSGCGKTTILSLISGLIKASSGEILVEGEVPSKKKNKAGYMFQKDNLFPWRTIEKNIYVGLEIQHKNTAENKKYAVELLKKYGLNDFLHKRPDELSGGMRQRVALIRTLALKPSILLLDEPFSALDFQTRLKVCDDVASIIKKEKKTAILVTHDINEAISMADKIFVLTARPAKVKSVHIVDFDKNLTPFQKRNLPESKKLFDKIWSEIQNEEK
ncbi:MAG: ABC transporter ATP-binding protein [Clostridia bacterium]|nr:ABC transporter ATP-binding protein [Clostridia bacterium]